MWLVLALTLAGCIFTSTSPRPAWATTTTGPTTTTTSPSLEHTTEVCSSFTTQLPTPSPQEVTALATCDLSSNLDRMRAESLLGLALVLLLLGLGVGMQLWRR